MRIKHTIFPSKMADAKKIRLDPKDYQTLYKKFQKFDDIEERMSIAYSSFFNTKATGLFPYQIMQCNADTNQPFSSAYCTLKNFFELSDEIYPFGSIFLRGVDILNNLLESESYMPEDDATKVLLNPLLAFLFDEESHIALRELGDEAENETQLMMTLAVHFFCKLSVSRGCTMNKHASGKISTELKNFATFGDTSIGHEDVWHGNLDIVLESSQIGVHCTSLDENENRPGLRSDGEVKFKELDSFLVRDQALAQTITFSFLQQQQDPAMKHFLIPSILASAKEVQFLFYDSKNDILLQSKPFPFFVEGLGMTLNYQTVIAAWLVLNYKYLCSGPTPNILRAPKADFPKFAGASLEIYKTKLRFEKVTEKSREKDQPWRVAELGLDECAFQWPKNLKAKPFDPTKKFSVKR